MLPATIPDGNALDDDEAATLLSRLFDSGFTVRADGAALYVEPRSRLSRDDCEQVRRHKDTLLRLVGEHQVEYVLRLRPLRSSVPPIIRLRRSLKMLLRCFGMQCTWGVERNPG